MSRLRILYVVSLVILGVLLVFTVFKPFATGEEYSEIQREQLLQSQDEWIIQFDLLNREGREAKYDVNTLVAGKQYNEQFLIQDGAVCTYIHRIPREMAGTGEVSVNIYKEGSDTPFEQITYWLK
jgi:hypothetical protein